MSQSGKCKLYVVGKGFGFAVTPDGREHFFHKSDIIGKPPKTDDILNFDVEPSSMKPGQTQAKNVTGGTCGGELQGTCKWYNEGKGYGFINYNGESYFMHVQHIAGNTPLEGDVLYFDFATDERDPNKQMCTNVTGGTGGPIDQGATVSKGMEKGMGKMMQMMSMMMSWGPYGKGKGKGKGKGDGDWGGKGGGGDWGGKGDGKGGDWGGKGMGW
eukprot:gb/GFBE01036979.1/.p1 GENE.gb/GFBE01036979.1/~~gb/GFBE01036979.1/.p1  ORF type:complete len:214 (+),score=76.39 gb/GFBE01036979.1/:1-642(+)